MPVDSTHPDYTAASRGWQICRDAVAGQAAVHARGEAYLPKLSEQDPKEYEAYKLRALYYNATGRTLDGLSGMIFRRVPTVKLPTQLEVLLDDADTAGTPLTAFSENTIDELLTVGRFGLLSDYTETGGARTQAEEQKLGARPFLVMYPAESIINWRRAKIGNRWQFDLVVLQVKKQKPKDQYTTEAVDQWLVLSLVDGVYTIQTFEKSKEATAGSTVFVEVEPAKQPMMGGRPMDFIPFQICGPRGVSDCVVKPPLLDMADVNLSHYRTTADYEHGLHFTGLPTPIVTGHTFDAGQKLALGAMVAQGFPDPNAKAYFLEFTGDGLSNLAKRLEEKEQMMVSLGARMLATEKRQVEAAETAAIHRSGENSVLSSLAIAASLAVTQGLKWCADFARVSSEIEFALNTDFMPAGMTSQELDSLVKAWQTGAISHETLYDNLVRGEIAQQGLTFEEEQERIATEPPKLGNVTGNADDE